MPRNEQQTRTELINPVIYEKGWVDALPLTAFPIPQDLRQRYEQIKGLQLTSDNTKKRLSKAAALMRFWG